MAAMRNLSPGALSAQLLRIRLMLENCVEEKLGQTTS
jgi:hypothetical protein